MQENPHSQSLSPDVPQETKVITPESKIRMCEDTPSQFGQTHSSLVPQVVTAEDEDSSVHPGVHSVDGTLTFSPESVVLQGKNTLEAEDEKEHKGHSLPFEPVKPLPLSLPQDIKENKDRPIITSGVKFPALRVALQQHYRQASHLKLPLSGKEFPIKDVSLTISDKSEQDQREKARQLAEEKEKKGSNQGADDDKEAKGSKKDKQDLFWSSRFRLEEEWHRITQPIAAKDLFTIEKSTTPTRRILVEGRAGVGKTTFSQYVAYQWAQQQLFASQFDYIFWLPLRQCLSTGSSQGSMEAHVAAFIYEQQIPASSRTQIRPQDIETVLSSGENGRTLLILDGFDEVAGQLSDSGQPFYVILDELLKFPHLIITTRDYQTPESKYPFDRRLVNVGFTDEQISGYIQSYCAFSDSSSMDQEVKTSPLSRSDSGISPQTTATQQAQTLEAALKQNPRFWGLAHIPLNLALICESWPSLTSPPAPTSTIPKDSKIGSIPHSDSKTTTVSIPQTKAELNVVSLYQNVLLCFLKRDMQKYEQSSTQTGWKELSESYALELLSLGAIAWQGMQGQQQILGAVPLNKALALIVSDYPESPETEVELAFTQALTLGFMRHDSGEDTTPLLERHYYFIHLTFQEYFAAHYVLQTLQGRRGKHACQNMQDWLAQHKFEPRYAVLLSFLAGLTTQPGYDQALQVFWHTLLSPPHDVVGAQHLQLMLRCLTESRFDSRIPARKQLLAEMRHWVDAMVLMVLRKNNKPWEEQIIDTLWLSALLHQEPKLLRLCGWTLPKAWIKAADDEDGSVVVAAMRALGRLGASLASHEEALQAVLVAAGDQNWDVRHAASEALRMGASLTSQPEALKAVLTAAGDQNGYVREVAIKALGGLGANLASHPEALAAVLKAAGDQEWLVRRFAINALGGLGVSLASHPEALAAVLKATTGDENVETDAIMALGRLGVNLAAHPEVLAVVLKAAGDQKSWKREAAIEAFGKLGASLVSHPEALQAVLTAVGDEEGDVRQAAIQVLGKLGASLASQLEALKAVLTAAGDEDRNVGHAAGHVVALLGASLASHPDALEAVLTAVGDQHEDVRVAAIWALGGMMQTSLASQLAALKAVLTAAGDQHKDVRKAAIEGLGRMQASFASHPEALAAVLKAAGDQDEFVGYYALKALGGLGPSLASQPEALKAVLTAAGDQHEFVRESAIRALGGLGTSLASQPEALQAVLTAAGDKDKDVRRVSIEALRGLGESLAVLPEALKAVLTAAGDQHEFVRQCAIETLGGLGANLVSYPEALVAVLKATSDQNVYVQQRAVQAGASLASHPEGLKAVLKAADAQGAYLRQAAIQTLGGLGVSLASHPDGLKAVLKAASDQGVYVRQVAMEALGGLGAGLTLRPEALAVVSKAASDHSADVRRAAIEALGGLGANLALHHEAFAAVFKAAGDQEWQVREVAIRALGKMGSSLSSHPKVLTTILKAAGDQTWEVQHAVDEVLKTLDLHLLIRGYLATAKQGQRLFSEENVYLPILLKRIEQEWPALVFAGQALTVVSGSRSEYIPLSSAELAHPLINAIEKVWKRHGFPQVSFKACVGKKNRYLQPKPLDFKATPKVPLTTGLQRRSTRVALPMESKRPLKPGEWVGSVISLDFNVPYRDLIFVEPVGNPGTFGAVSRGTHRLETVAIKQFKLKDFSAAKQEEIRSEARVMAVIQSDYLVRLRGICLEEPHYCLVMEYLPKGDLYGLLYPKKTESVTPPPPKPLSASQRYRLAVDMAIGLYHLHQQGILHRDLKSLNVLLQEREGELRAKISDFGLSTLKRSLLHGEGMVGSLPWLAPEIVAGSGEYSKASDVYSLGLVLYELASGKVPYYDLPDKPAIPSVRQINDWILAGERPWNYLPEDCPTELARLIRDCCAEDPKDRPAANVVFDRLEKLYTSTKQAEPKNHQVLTPISFQPKADEKEEKNARREGDTKENQYSTHSTPSVDSPPEEPLNSIGAQNTPVYWLQELLRQGGSVNQVDGKGRSYLHRAVASQDKALVQALLTHGARIDLPDHKSVTPLDLALNLGKTGESLVALLLQAHKPSSTSTSQFSEYARLLQATIQWGLRGAEQEMLRRSEREAKQPSGAAQALTAYAATWGYACQPMEKDGNCFYHAVSHQLQQQLEISIPYDKLRAIATAHVLDHLALYSGSVDQNMHTFIDKMSQNKQWADEIHLRALSRALNLTLILVRSDKAVTILRREKPSAILYLGYEVGVHYQSLTVQTPALCEKLKKECIDNAEIDHGFKDGGLSLDALKKLDQPTTTSTTSNIQPTSIIGTSHSSTTKSSGTDPIPSGVLPDSRLKLDEKTQSREDKKHHRSVDLTPASAMVQIGQFKKSALGAIKIKSRVQRGTIIPPGNALICLAFSTESGQSARLLIETVTTEGEQRCWIYTLSQQQGVFHHRVQEIPTTEELPDLQGYELTTQPTTLSHSAALQHYLEELQDKPLATEHIRTDGSVDWEALHDELMAQATAQQTTTLMI